MRAAPTGPPCPEYRERRTESDKMTHSKSASRATLVATLLALALTAALSGGCAHRTAPTVEGGWPLPGETPKNIVLMIGDGMGAAHVTAAMVEAGSLNMERLPLGGLMSTHAENSFLTDSAASGTAMATGHKTNNGMVSVTPDGAPLRTVIEHAEEKGLSTGLVATCSITHATPAVFVAHARSRDNHTEIARQIADSEVDVLFGGGAMYFLPRTGSGGIRDDAADLLSAMRARMPVALTTEEFAALPDGDAAAALLYPEHPPRASQRSVSLTDMTKRAIEILSRDDDGFFLMVEGSQIDWAGHENDQEWLIEETLDFDRAVGAAMDFAEMDGETLVIVTADHECGGYLLFDASLESRKVTWSEFGCDTHSATIVPLLAYGPGGAGLGGIMDNTTLGRTLIDYVRR
ncbi:MAG: alkaline phosphatase [Candidatus Eisenbacteria bacterium]|nr:alkaline phosphatase [Candidatus Eisenbacteria bacterium]